MPTPDRLHGRNGKIYRMYLHGYTQQAIADEVGITQQRISEIIRDVRESTPLQLKDELIQRAAGLLDELLVEHMKIVHERPAPAYSAGRPIVFTGPDGTEIQAVDHSARLTAMAGVLKIQERAAKMFGLDAATRMEHTVNAEETAAALAMASAAAERLMRARQEDA